MPSFLDDSPALRIHPSIRISFIRVARMLFPLPAPPHIKKKKETSWNASYACVHSSSISRMSAPEMLAHRLNTVKRNTRHEPIGVVSLDASERLYKKARFAHIGDAFALLVRTVRGS